jgi:hypothetical protein
MSGIGEYALRVAAPGDNETVSALLSASYKRLLAPDYEPCILAAALPLMTRANPRLLESGTYYVAVTLCRSHCQRHDHRVRRLDGGMSPTVALPSILMRCDLRYAGHQVWLTIYPS